MNQELSTKDCLIIPVILSGGSGTRLWPLSRSSRPKQMQALIGEWTMLQMTARRILDAERFAPPMVVTNAAYAEEAARQMEAAGVPASRLIVEPCGRNTAPAVALAALEAAPEDLLLVMPSDHVICNEEAFRAAVETGASLAEQGWLVTFGITPDLPETGYGYIKRGAELARGAFRSERFVEKPDYDTAARYLQAGCYDWNGGIFLFRASAFVAELGAHADDILERVSHAHRAACRHGKLVEPHAALFSAVRSQSIDHAVMEHAARVAVVPVAMGWSDVGSWDALYEFSDKDEARNVIRGEVCAIDSRGSLIRSDGRVVVTVGVDDLIVVVTEDAVLILPRGEAQRVKEGVEALKERSHPSL